MINQYCIRELLSKYMLFVPEIQRDYVWGSKDNIDNVLKPFINTLNKNLSDNSNYNIGFLYSYTNTTEDNYIIDGQQRFTTIVLLLYVLSVREGKDFDLHIGLNKPTMRFTYNVRPQTEAFLRRLFESKETNEEKISNQTWFLPEYTFDTTITSMVNAVNMFSSVLPDLPNITYDKILNQVNFWYFNVDETSQGEELYITMNSRGQKLTDSEQIKPYLFDKWNEEKKGDGIDYGKKWDEWEETFYSKKGNLSIKSVDIAMNSFLRIIYEMESLKECKNIPFRDNYLTLPIIAKYMDSMMEYAQKEWPKLLSDDDSYDPHMVLKALIAEGLKPIQHKSDRDRVEHVFTNIVTRRKIRKHNEILAFLHEYARTEKCFYDFITQYEELSSRVFDEHELCKINIYKRFADSPAMQNKIELAFEDAEKRAVWSGNISPLITWSLSDENDFNSFSFDVFQIYAQKFDTLFGDVKLNQKEMDVTRRALLAYGLHDYPRIFRGNTNTCFAYEPEDWHKLFLDHDNIPLMKSFFDKYDRYDSMIELINDCPEKEYSEFVHNPELLEYCKQKNIQWWWNTIYLINGSTAHGKYANIHSYKYYLLRKDNLSFQGWTKLELHEHGISCVYLNCENQHIAVDAYWNGGHQNKQMGIDVFRRVDDSQETLSILKPILKIEGFHWNGQRYSCYFDKPIDEQESFNLMDKKLKEVIDFVNANIL